MEEPKMKTECIFLWQTEAYVRLIESNQMPTSGNIKARVL